MAKLDRVTAKVFAASAAADEIGQFGSAVAGSKLETADVATIQGLSAWLDGWSEALVSGNRYPALQEMNGLLKVLSYQGAYALQEGIPEYDSATTYYIGSIVKKTGTFELYGSLTDDNVGNALTVGTDWKFLVDLASLGGGGGVVDFDNKGTVTTDITLVENVITTGYWSGTNTITLPTVTDTTKQVTCILDFTTATSSQPTITNTNLKWSDKNGGKPPSTYLIISGVHNILTFKSIWEGSNLYWEAEYSTYGGIETTFVRPNLSSNGTLGGTSFAIDVSGVYGGSAGYLAVDGNSATEWAGGASSGWWIKLYNPIPLKVYYFTIQNIAGGSYVPTSGSVYASNDNSVWTFLGNWTNSNTTAGATWNLTVGSGLEFYKYYRVDIAVASPRANIAEINMSAVYIAV